MKPSTLLQFEERDASAFAADLLAELPGFVPGWTPTPGGPGWAVVQIFARQLQALAERLNLAPGKNKVSFLDLLGISLLPAQAARAPLCFRPLPRLPDVHVPARMRAGAKVPGRADPLIFETEQAVALAAAQLAEVVTLWPGRDAYADHTASALGGQPFALFEPLRPVPHELYLAHDTHFALGGAAIVELQFDLDAPSSQVIPLVWEYWDGKVWRGFKDFTAEEQDNESFDGTLGLTRSGIVRLVSDCAKTARTKVNGLDSFWLRARVTTPMPPRPDVIVPQISRLDVTTVIDQESAKLPLDSARAAGSKLDLSKSFYPVGGLPRPGAAFYFSSKEAFSKPGAKVTLATAIVDPAPTEGSPVTSWEYWNGERWGAVQVQADAGADTFMVSGTIALVVPDDLAPTKVDGEEALWMRAVLASGGYVITRTIAFTVDGKDSSFPIKEPSAPALASITLGYTYRPLPQPPQVCLTWNDFRWDEHTDQTHGNGSSFAPFSVVEDVTPALYLGFDKPLPADRIGLYLDLLETSGLAEGPRLNWEYWDGEAWQRITVEDESNNLALPGIVSAVWPGVNAPEPARVIEASGTSITLADAQEAAHFQPDDLLFISAEDKGEMVRVVSVSGVIVTVRTPLSRDYSQAAIARAALPRFGTPRTWLRARLQDDGEPTRTIVQGIWTNAVWASQVQTFENELLGSGNGQPGQVFFFRNTPVLGDEVVEVRELDGARAAVELPMLLEELQQHGLGEADVRTVLDRRTGKIGEVWVRWRIQPNLFFSGPGDRHYVLERSRGRLLSGDNRFGRAIPAGRDNVRVRVYVSGGGTVGNVPAGAITQLLSGVPAKGISNPRAGEGGADGEDVEGVQTRGPQVLRHLLQAITPADYEALAREASPAVAVARALPATHPSGRLAPGWVRVLIMPQSQEPQPQPSFELRQRVLHFLQARAPGSLAGQISVDGPTYLPVGIEAVVTPVDPEDAGPTGERIRQAVGRFLHPLTGGAEDNGWPPGRHVFLSDVAALLERVTGVDHVSELRLLLDGTPQGEELVVPPDRIVVAGELRLRLQ